MVEREGRSQEQFDPVPLAEHTLQQGGGHELSEKLRSVLTSEQYTPEASIDSLKAFPRFAELLQQPAVREGYSIEEHTLMVLRQFEKHFGDIDLPGKINRAEMRLLLLLHDIGKGIGEDRGDQHTYTMDVIEELRDSGLFSEDTFRLITAPISMDALGHYLYHATANGPSAEEKLVLAQKIAGGDIQRSDFDAFAADIHLVEEEKVDQLADEAVDAIRKMAKQAGLAANELFDILTIYYQCDTLAYTFEAARDVQRSTILTASDVGKIRFNHDKELRAMSGLDANPGEKSWEAYARLEKAARTGELACFPIEHGYPSLDFLYVYHPDFDPELPVDELLMFVVDKAARRLPFAEGIEPAYLLLRKKLLNGLRSDE